MTFAGVWEDYEEILNLSIVLISKINILFRFMGERKA